MHQILVANQPRVLREMLRRALEAQPRLSVVGEVGDLERLPGEIERTGADRVIVSLGTDGALPGPVAALIVQFPTVLFCGVANDGSRLKIQRLAHEERVENPDLETLIAALDGAPEPSQALPNQPQRKSKQGGTIH